MYALFAKVNKKNSVFSINLKKVLSNSTNIISFSDLQAKIESDTAHTVTFTDKLIKNNTINKLIENSMNGLYFIKRMDDEIKKYQIIVPSMLFSDYTGYMKTFRKEFKSNQKTTLIKNTRISKEIHDMLASKKINIQSMINILVTRLLPSSKYPSNYSTGDALALQRVLKKKGNKGSCIKSYDKYFKIKPDPCKNYFKLDIKTLSTNYEEKKKKERIAKSIRKKAKRAKINKKSQVQVGNISQAMGYAPNTKTKPPPITNTEVKMRIRSSKEKRKKKSIKHIIKQEKRKIRTKKKLKREEEKLKKQLLRSVKKLATKNRNSTEKMDFENFTNKLKIKKNDNFAMILFRAIIITVIAVSLLGVVNKPLFINLLKILKIPANTIMNILKFNNKPSQ